MWRHFVLIALFVQIAAPLQSQFVPLREIDAPLGTVTTNDVVSRDPDLPPAPLILTATSVPDLGVNFQGLGDDNSSTPSDTMGAVGPNHVVTMLNTQVCIRDRSGVTNISTQSLASWWAGAGAFTNVFDPRITFDPYNNRWIASAATEGFGGTQTAGVAVAVSLTSDPTGTWYYRYQAADTTTSKALWIDYPTLGFNKTWIIVSANVFSNYVSGGGLHTTPIGTRMYIYDKLNLYTNGTTCTITNLPSTWGNTIVPATTYDNTLPYLWCLKVWNSRYTNALSTNWHGALRVFGIGGTASSPTIDLGGLAETDPWARSTVEDNFLPQTNSTVKIDAGDSRLQSVVYRKGKLWTVHTIFLPDASPTHAAVQWWQLSVSGISSRIAYFLTILQRGKIEDTGATNHYAYPSIAVNQAEDALIGYSAFSKNRYASGEFAIRAPGDLPNKLRSTRVVVKEGRGIFHKTFGSGVNRWGDYSATVVDPVNDMDFWTLQAYAELPNGDPATDDTGRWGVWWGKINPTRPPNDNFQEAAELTGVIGSTNSTMFRGTAESGEPSHADKTPTRSIWFKWTAQTNGWVYFTTYPSLSRPNTVLAAYTGGSLTNLSCVASNDNFYLPHHEIFSSGLSYQSKIKFNASAGTTYRIAVDTWDSTSEDNDKVTLWWTQPVVPYFFEDPKDKDILAGDTLILTSTALGIPMPWYQWQFNGTNIVGATNANYTNSSIALTNGGTYDVVATNYYGSATSDISVVTVYTSATAINDSVAIVSDDKFKFTVTGIPGYNYVVQATTDFTNWVAVFTNASSFVYTNTNNVTTNFPVRFFRTIY